MMESCLVETFVFRYCLVMLKYAPLYPLVKGRIVTGGGGNSSGTLFMSGQRLFCSTTILNIVGHCRKKFNGESHRFILLFVNSGRELVMGRVKASSWL